MLPMIDFVSYIDKLNRFHGIEPIPSRVLTFRPALAGWAGSLPAGRRGELHISEVLHGDTD